jgi:hypothetical protein
MKSKTKSSKIKKQGVSFDHALIQLGVHLAVQNTPKA